MRFQISLSAARENAELKQYEAAELLGITPKTLRNYERGITAIPGHMVKSVSKLYNIPEDFIRLPIVRDNQYDEEEKNLDITTV